MRAPRVLWVALVALLLVRFHASGLVQSPHEPRALCCCQHATLFLSGRLDGQVLSLSAGVCIASDADDKSELPEFFHTTGKKAGMDAE